MSDSDDTEYLLLIPPDFFLLNSDDEAGISKSGKDDFIEKEVVSHLIGQVNDLKYRVSAIESESSSLGGTPKCLPTRVLSTEENVRDWLNRSSFEEMDGGKRLELSEVDRLLKEMEVTQRDIEAKLKQREQDANLGDGPAERPRTLSLLGDNLGSVPDLGFGVRALFSDSPKSSEKKPAQEEPCTKASAYTVGSESPSERRLSARRRLSLSGEDRSKPQTESAILQRSKVLEGSPLRATERDVRDPLARPLLQDTPLHRVGRADGTSSTDIHNVPEHLLNTNLPHPSKIPNLGDLWRGEDDSSIRNPLKLRQRLEEEKHRRTHLESTVAALQRRILEEQEKVAVAIQVDEKKDEVIARLTESWRRLVDHWRQIEEQRHEAAQALLKERANIAKAQDDIAKKVSRWEREVSQALDLAATFKAKSELAERDLEGTKNRCDDLEKRLHEATANSSDLGVRLDRALSDNREERSRCDDLRVEVSRLEGTISRLEAEISCIKEQRESLATSLREERARANLMEQGKREAEARADQAARLQKESEDKFAATSRRMENVKTELRSLYQAQVEKVVSEKLVEFQSQLEASRADMRSQLESELQQAHQSATLLQQQLAARHAAELRRITEVKDAALAAAERKAAEAEVRASRLERAKRDTAAKLHALMERQWQQALNIITNEANASRLTNGHSSVSAPNEIPIEHQNGNGGGDVPRTIRIVQPDTTACTDSTDATSDTTSLLQPPSTLLNYIRLLLDKQPGRPVDSINSSVLLDSTLSDHAEALHAERWAQAITPLCREENQGPSKPPWK